MNFKLIGITKKVFDVLFWLGVLATVFVVGALVIAIVAGDIEGVGGGLIVDGPVVDDVTALGDARIRVLLVGIGVTVVSTLGLFLYIAFQIRRALGSILVGSAFRAENYGRLRRIAFAIFWLAVIEVVSVLWTGAVVNGALDVNIPIWTLADGLLALSIAEIYKAGITLQDENELTV